MCSQCIENSPFSTTLHHPHLSSITTANTIRNIYFYGPYSYIQKILKHHHKSCFFMRPVECWRTNRRDFFLSLTEYAVRINIYDYTLAIAHFGNIYLIWRSTRNTFSQPLMKTTHTISIHNTKQSQYILIGKE